MKEIIQSNNLRKLLFLAILLRVLIIPFFFHPDIRIYHFQTSFLREGVFNIYDYLIENRQNLPYKEEFVYFPLTYFLLGGYQIIASPLLGLEFNNWLFGEQTQNLFRYLFILKFPYLLIDILIALLLYGIFNEKKYKKLAFVLWLFNPFSIALIYFYSNIDILPVFFTLLSFLFIKKNKSLPAGLFLAIGAGFKVYPILLIPAILLTNEKIEKRILGIIISIASFIFILIPFWSRSFIESSFSSGLTNKIFEYGLDIGLPRKIPFYFILYILGFCYIYLKNRKNALSFYLMSTLMLVALVNFNIQWLLWFIPFLILRLVNNMKYLISASIMMFSAIIIPSLINDKYLTVGLYLPINNLFLQLSYPHIFISKFINPLYVTNLFRLAFFISGIFIAYQSIKSKNAE